MDMVIVGASGFALEAAWLAEECGYNVVGFLDDAAERQEAFVLGRPVLGKVNDWINYQNHHFVVAVGAPRVRKEVVDKMRNAGEPKFVKLVHPSVQMSPYITIGAGTMICAGCILTVEVDIGEHCIVNINTTVGHEVLIGDFSTIAPIAAISGRVKLAGLCEIGTNAAVRQGVSIGYGSMLGMGAVLTKDIPDHKIYVGSPARFLREAEK